MSSSASTAPLLVTPKQLHALPLGTTKILDASWHMPNSSRNAAQEYLNGPRIPKALRWDVDKVATTKTTASDPDEPHSWTSSSLSQNPLGLGHMMPGPAKFAKACRALGITKDDHVVVYDTVGVFSSPRTAVTFKAMGHAKVSVLDGGLPRWIAEGYPLDKTHLKSVESINIPKSEYPIPEFDANYITTYSEIVENAKQTLEDPSTSLVLDARSHGRWSGEAPEPRKNLSSGHIPHSLSLPFTELVTESQDSDPRYTHFKPAADLQSTILSALSDNSTDSRSALKTGQIRWEEIKRGKRNVVWSCGSGMTACVGVWAMNVLAEHQDAGVGLAGLLGKDQRMRVGVYDEVGVQPRFINFVPVLSIA